MGQVRRRVSWRRARSGAMDQISTSLTYRIQLASFAAFPFRQVRSRPLPTSPWYPTVPCFSDFGETAPIYGLPMPPRILFASWISEQVRSTLSPVLPFQLEPLTVRRGTHVLPNPRVFGETAHNF